MNKNMIEKASLYSFCFTISQAFPALPNLPFARHIVGSVNPQHLFY